MLRLLLLLACAASLLCGQSGVDRRSVAPLLGFEPDHALNTGRAWRGLPAGTVFIDEAVVRSGRRALRIERTARSEESESAAGLVIPVDFSGLTVELRGFLRSEGVEQVFGFFLDQSGSDGKSLALEDMKARQRKGTTDWTEYSIRLPLNPDVRWLAFGVLLTGPGKVWADDLQLLVDGKPIAEATPSPKAETIIGRDRKFDGGSKIQLTELTTVQTANLTTLGRVWGFLKYHHPRITNGEFHWDYELFRILPKVLQAPDRAAANAVMHEWIAGLGPVPDCEVCAQLDENHLHLRPSLEWLADESLLGPVLTRTLRSIHRNRPAAGNQFYVELVKGTGNAVFRNEPEYASLKLPDAGYQLLALYRFWNLVEYWFPYRDVIGEDWDAVLARFVPRLALAKSSDEYRLELMPLIGSVNDSHATPDWRTFPLRPPQGDCMVPVVVRFIEDKPVAVGYSDSTAGPATGLKIGDVIAARDGTPVTTLVERWTPYYPASNQPARLRDIARQMLRAPCGSQVRLRREGDAGDLSIETTSLSNFAMSAALQRGLPGDAFRLLSGEVAYLKTSDVNPGEVKSFIGRANGTKGLIIDLRENFSPSVFSEVVFELGGAFVARRTPFASITGGDLSNPGAFYWRERLFLAPATPRYEGKVVIVVDEATQSKGEFAAMAFRASSQAIVVGSTTAGADGDVSEIALPGGLRTRFSGAGVFYPDQRLTQRIGIVPDVEVRPTVAGIREGRDEVLEEALRQILGSKVPLAELQKLIPK